MGEHPRTIGENERVESETNESQRRYLSIDNEEAETYKGIESRTNQRHSLLTRARALSGESYRARSLSDETRQCYICLESVTLSDISPEEWVSPCRCTGTMAWVHRNCLMHWVRDQEAAHPGTPVSCSQCLTKFVLLPKKNFLVSLLEWTDRTVYPFCKVVAGMAFVSVAVEVAVIGGGIFAFTQIYGLEQGFQNLTDMDIPKTLTKLHTISYSLFFVSWLPWEDSLLRSMRWAHRLPLFGRIMPEDAPARVHPPNRRSWYRIITNAILLPVYSRVVGALFFSSMESRVDRSLFSGLCFLVVKGSIYMYYKQKQLTRRKYMRVIPPPRRAIQTTADINSTN